MGGSQRHPSGELSRSRIWQRFVYRPVSVHRRFTELNLNSLLILTVHDSIVVDTHPDEVDAERGLHMAMTGVLDKPKNVGRMISSSIGNRD